MMRLVVPSDRQFRIAERAILIFMAARSIAGPSACARRH
jgi:hypothetical protein